MRTWVRCCITWLWDEGVSFHFCDTRESFFSLKKIVFGVRPFLLYHIVSQKWIPFPTALLHNNFSSHGFALFGFPASKLRKGVQHFLGPFEYEVVSRTHLFWQCQVVLDGNHKDSFFEGAQIHFI